MTKAAAPEIVSQTFGDSRDPAMLLIMGSMASMLWWPEALCKKLAGEGRFVIRYDNRDTGLSTPLRHLEEQPVLHWHGDTFTLPEGTELLASSERYENQAFRRGTNILALQFHAEMGLDPRFVAWLEGSPEGVARAGGEDRLRADHAALCPGAVAAG